MPRRVQRDKSILLICDMQDNFAEETYCYEGVMVVAGAMVRAAKKL